jgi:hypothetical protein
MATAVAAVVAAAAAVAAAAHIAIHTMDQAVTNLSLCKRAEKRPFTSSSSLLSNFQ